MRPQFGDGGEVFRLERLWAHCPEIATDGFHAG
jgi:hypothetical protein